MMDKEYTIEYHPMHMRYEEAKRYAMASVLTIKPEDLYLLLAEAEEAGWERGIDNGSN